MQSELNKAVDELCLRLLTSCLVAPDEVAELQRREVKQGIEVDASAAAYMQATSVSGRRHSVATEVSDQAQWLHGQALKGFAE